MSLAENEASVGETAKLNFLVLATEEKSLKPTIEFFWFRADGEVTFDYYCTKLYELLNEFLVLSLAAGLPIWLFSITYFKSEID